MLNAVINFLDKEVEQINQIPRLAEKYQSLKALHKSIRKLSNEKSKDLKVITDDRNKLRDRVNLVAIQLSGTLVSYALEKDLNKLSQRVKFNPSDLSGVSVNKNLDFLETLLSSAEEFGVEELEGVIERKDSKRSKSKFFALVFRFSTALQTALTAFQRYFSILNRW